MKMQNKQGEILMNICCSSQGCFEIDPDASEPHGNCAYSKLAQHGHNRDSIINADGKGAKSFSYLRMLARPGNRAGGEDLDKCLPK